MEDVRFFITGGTHVAFCQISLHYTSTLVLVIVALVDGVTVSVVDVVDMIVVGHCLMPAVLAVDMVVVGMLDVGKRVLVIVATVVGMGVAVVDVVDMVIVIDGSMPTTGPVFMGMVGMYGVVDGSHGFSFEWVTASATM